MIEPPEKDPLHDFFRRDDSAVPKSPPHELRTILNRTQVQRSPFDLTPTVWTRWLVPVASVAAIVLALGTGLWRRDPGDTSFLPDNAIVLEYPEDAEGEDEAFGEEWLALAEGLK